MQTTSNIALPEVLFFGRPFDEYMDMFDLQPQALNGLTILDCPAGPSEFACCSVKFGAKTIACDPMYEQRPEQLRQQINIDCATADKVYASHSDKFDADLKPMSDRRRAMDAFLQDFERNSDSGVYVPAKLPSLPFADRTFDLVLSANFLFLYSDAASGGTMPTSPFDYKFHSASIAELLRVCRGEVRIYPLIGPRLNEHAYVPEIVRECQSKGHEAQLIPVKQREMIGADHMLRIVRTKY